MQRCYQCQKELKLKEKPGRRDTCPFCQADLHCCFNCRFYSPTASQQCAIPTVEAVKNKKNANFCDEFEIREFQRQSNEGEGVQTKKRWDELFRGL